MQILQKYILNTLVFDEDQKSLSQTVTWLNLAGHHAEPCKDYTEFVDKLTNEEMCVLPPKVTTQYRSN